VPKARHRVRDELLRAGLPYELCDTAALVVSELVTNAVLRAEGPEVHCRALFMADGVRLEVRDGGTAEVIPGAAGGMLLVERVTGAWGVEPDRDGAGRTVWATLPRTRAARSARCAKL
jgi:anti-sigma regulatory factor (Ser/Thr protein kinase)